MDSYSKDEYIGATRVHEIRLITDKNSRCSRFPNKPASAVEKEHGSDETKYYWEWELNEQKKQQKP